MNARLFCRTGELAGNEFEIQNEATIGKATTNTIVLAPGTISGQHARIVYDETAQSYFLEDAKSRNGTKLDGMPVTAREKLGKLHVITFANLYDFIFQIPDSGVPIAARPVADAEQPVSRTAAVQDLPPVPPALNADRAAPSRTVAESDIPLLAPNLQAGEQSSPKTMAESDIPLMTPQNLRPGQPGGSKTMAESDIPLMTPQNLRSGQPGASKTMAESDIPQIPKFNPQSPQPQPPQQGKTMAESDLPLLPQFKPGQKMAPASQAPVSYLLEAVKDNKRFALASGENVIGRSEKAAITIEHSTVSRKHAMIIVAGSKVTVKDLGSANHTFVDNQKIDTEVEITPSNKIRFGSVEVRLLTQS